MKLSFFCLLFIVVISLNACWETTAADYQKGFSCMVNGQLWFPAGETTLIFGPDLLMVNHKDNSDYIDIRASRGIVDKYGVIITAEGINLDHIRLKANEYTKIDN